MKDFFNKKKRRTELNTSILNYNCGGYALRTFSWYMPYESAESRELHANNLYNQGRSISEIYDLLLLEDKKALKKHLGWKIRFIHDLKDIQKDEEAVVYKFFLNFNDTEDGLKCDYSDFHFRVLRSGAWKEKIGDDPVEFAVGVELYKPWRADCGEYNSFPIIMAVKI